MTSFYERTRKRICFRTNFSTSAFTRSNKHNVYKHHSTTQPLIINYRLLICSDTFECWEITAETLCDVITVTTNQFQLQDPVDGQCVDFLEVYDGELGKKLVCAWIEDYNNRIIIFTSQILRILKWIMTTLPETSAQRHSNVSSQPIIKLHSFSFRTRMTSLMLDST